MKNLFLICSAIALMTACKKTNKQDEPAPTPAEPVCRISEITGIGKYEYDGKGNVAKSYSIDSLGNITNYEFIENFYNDNNQLVSCNEIEKGTEKSSYKLTYYADGLLQSITIYNDINLSGKVTDIYQFYYTEDKLLKYSTTLNLETIVSRPDSTVYSEFDKGKPTLETTYKKEKGIYGLSGIVRKIYDANGNVLQESRLENGTWYKIVERTFDTNSLEFAAKLVPLYATWNKPSGNYWVNTISTLKYYGTEFNSKGVKEEVIYGDSEISYITNSKGLPTQQIFLSKSPNKPSGITTYHIKYICR